MISDTMATALNKQIALEAHASSLYLSMSSWCEQEGLVGCAQFMRRQSEEEREHMLRIFDYLNERNVHALAPAVPQPKHTFESIQKMFAEVFEHEKKVTASIMQLVDLSTQQNDHTTSLFLQWYVDEQREEEALMSTLMDRIRLIGTGGQSLYYIDKEVERLNAAEASMEE
ncbi:MAG: ferritin [Bacteroidota bacterium]